MTEKKKSQIIYEEHSNYIMDHKMSPFFNDNLDYNPLKVELLNAVQKSYFNK